MDGNKIAAAAEVNEDIFSVWLPNEATIFTAEAKAIELAFEYIRISKNTHILQYFLIAFLFMYSFYII